MVLEAGDPGSGCSTRNGGQVHASIMPGATRLLDRLGPRKTYTILSEGPASVDWLDHLIGREEIACDFARSGSFHAAHTPWHFDMLAREVENGSDPGAKPAILVTPQNLHTEIGSAQYFGGVVHPKDGALHPGKYHRGLLDRVISAGATVIAGCAALRLSRDGEDFEVETTRGRVRCRDVAIATNGYTTSLTPWLKRRVVPIGSYVIATEPIDRGLVDRLLPTDRAITDTCKVIYYYRASSDRRRIVFGGRVSATETDPLVSGPRLHWEMCRIFPELGNIGISHSWCGSVAFSFDELPHIGVHEGMHYAMGYCGSGVAMASYLGMKMGRKVLGHANSATAFDDLVFQTRPFYYGEPWFLPAVVSWYRWKDARERRSAVR